MKKTKTIQWLGAGVVLILGAILITITNYAPKTTETNTPPYSQSDITTNTHKDTKKLNTQQVWMLSEFNPKTGKTYGVEEIQRISYLREQFPENKLVPALTPQEKQARIAAKQKQEALSLKLTAGKADASDIRKYYRAKKRMLRDRIQLVKYVVAEEGEEWDQKIIQDYKRMLKNSVRLLKQLEERQKRSLLVLKIRHQGL